jgi:hypothetical protein
VPASAPSGDGANRCERHSGSGQAPHPTEAPINTNWLTRSFGASILIAAALLFSSRLALAQFLPQGPKLVGTGAVAEALQLQGRSVALSADGNTASVGGIIRVNDNPLTGAAWVFTRRGGVWTQPHLRQCDLQMIDRQ